MANERANQPNSQWRPGQGWEWLRDESARDLPADELLARVLNEQRHGYRRDPESVPRAETILGTFPRLARKP